MGNSLFSKISCVGLLCLLFLNAKSQVWQPVGSGLPWYSNSAYTFETIEHYNELIVGYCANDPFLDQFYTGISKWNGVTWIHYPTVKDTSGVFPNPNVEIAIFQGDFYMNSLSGVDTGTALLRFNGVKWDTLSPPGFDKHIVTSLKTIGNKLYIGGYFEASNGIKNIMTFDGVNFSALPQIPTINLGVSDIATANGNIYALCLGQFLAFVPFDSCFLVLDTINNTWQSATNNFPQVFFAPTQLLADGNKIYMYNRNNQETPLIFQNNAISVLPASGLIIKDACLYNGQFTLLGDSVNVGLVLNIYQNGSYYTIPSVPPWLTEIRSFNNHLYGFSRLDMPFNNIQYNHAFQMADSLSILAGQVFMDANANCQFDATENTAGKAIIHFSTGETAFSDTNGQYQRLLASGTISIDSITSFEGVSKNLVFACPSINPIALATNQTKTQNIGVNNPVANDIGIKIIDANGFQARFGFQEKYIVMVYNAGNQTQSNVNVAIQIPPTLVIDSVQPPATSSVGNQRTFMIQNLPPAATQVFEIYTTVDTQQNSLGDTLHTSATCTLLNDVDQSDNTDTLSQLVVGAFDPNDKTPNRTLIYSGNTKIDYHLRFQNTGTDTAFRIVVVDTLSSLLTLGSIKMNAASHAYTLRNIDNVLVWEFDNILLPDSTTNEKESHGYLNFTMHVAASIKAGDTIKNFADIYFDFQPPVRTNTAKTVFISGLGLHEIGLDTSPLLLFPNPAKDSFTLKNISNSDLNFELMDVLGRTHANGVLTAQSEQVIRINLKPGLYLIRAETSAIKLIIE